MPEVASSSAKSPPQGVRLLGFASLPAPPLWLKHTPWAVLGGTVLLAMCVLAFELGNLKKEREFTFQVTLEKGGSFINALEGALQTGSGFHWADAELEALVRRVGSGADIRGLALVDAQGRVLLGMDKDSVVSAESPDATEGTTEGATEGTTASEGTTGSDGTSPAEAKNEFKDARKTAAAPLWETPPPEGLQAMALPDAGTTQGGRLRITRRIHVDSDDMHRGHRHGGRRAALRFARASTPLWVAVEYDMTAIDAARQADRTHRMVIGLILVFITFLGGMMWYLLRGYVRSRRMVQETSAFTGHIVRTLPVGVVATDAEGRITVINPEASRIMGTSMREAVGSLLRDMWPALGTPSAEDSPTADGLTGGLQPGQALLEREMRCSFGGRGGRGEGEARASVPLSVSASPLHCESGEELGHVLILRDLGEIRHLQAELRRRDRLAALGTLAARVAHEVRNPLSAIRGIARYFEECYPVGSEDAELARTLGQEVLRLDKVVGELLDLARPDIIERKPVALDALVEQARRMAAPALQEGNVDFDAQLPAPVPVVMVDGDRMGQVLVNLLLNAVDAMRESARKRLVVRATVEVGSAGETLLTLEVADSGPGIALDKMQDIFSPYYTTKPRGTGLGLSIVHKIVEAHDGVIEVKNSEGGGCVMTVRLPLPALLPHSPLPLSSSSPSPAES